MTKAPAAAYLRRMRRIVALLAALSLLSACAEQAVIKSYPAGAKAYVDGQLIGSTPAYTIIPRVDIDKPHTWRVEYRSCDFAEGTLQKAIAPGRIVGYFFTLGILAIFRSPYYFRPADAVLTGGDCETGKAAAPAQPTGAAETATNAQKLTQRLDTLRDLYNRKVISKQVYDRESQQAVEEYSTAPRPATQ